MGNKKIVLKYLENYRARKAAYRRRKEAIGKKISALCKLCDIKGCIITYNPDSEAPFVWPSNEVVTELLARLRAIPDLERSKKAITHEQYMKSRIEKLEEEIGKQETKNKRMEACLLMHKMLNGQGMLEVSRYSEAELLSWYSMYRYQEAQQYKRCFPPLSTRVVPTQPRQPLVEVELANANVDSSSGTNVDVLGEWRQKLNL